jgi:hypothetical protein
MPDGCDNVIACGGGCNGNRTCVANVCVKGGTCTPKTACDPGQCGVVSDGCADVLHCGGCDPGKSCVNNVCQ